MITNQSTHESSNNFTPKPTPEVGKYYVVCYEENLFPVVLTSINADGSLKIKCLQKA